jgi:hypothetical protein
MPCAAALLFYLTPLTTQPNRLRFRAPILFPSAWFLIPTGWYNSYERTPTDTPPTDFDGAWKAALERHFEAFLELCFPDIHNDIDWT